MGLELAELRLLEALRAQATDLPLGIRVVGGRSARRHARRVDGRWIPARGHTLPRRAESGADLVHLLGLDLPPPRRKPFVAMVHDLSPLRYDDEGLLPPWLGELASRASFLLTPSAFTAAELHRHLGVPSERVRVIGSGPGLEAWDAQPLSPSELSSLGVERPFVLRYGGYTKRKNVPLLLDAWAQVPSGTLVLAGPAQPARAKILSEAPSLDRVVVLDYVSWELLARLLRTAAALVSTSSYEGVGLPPLEAMAAGTPVVAVSTPFVREVCGGAALLVEGTPDALANALDRVIVDRDLARDLRAAGLARAARFTWKSSAATVLNAYASALA
jgi:glycosyltransferase involved in cell wall biosynthesis